MVLDIWEAFGLPVWAISFHTSPSHSPICFTLLLDISGPYYTNVLVAKLPKVTISWVRKTEIGSQLPSWTGGNRVCFYSSFESDWAIMDSASGIAIPVSKLGPSLSHAWFWTTSCYQFKWRQCSLPWMRRETQQIMFSRRREPGEYQRKSTR